LPTHCSPTLFPSHMSLSFFSPLRPSAFLCHPFQTFCRRIIFASPFADRVRALESTVEIRILFPTLVFLDFRPPLLPFPFPRSARSNGCPPHFPCRKHRVVFSFFFTTTGAKWCSPFTPLLPWRMWLPPPPSHNSFDSFWLYPLVLSNASSRRISPLGVFEQNKCRRSPPDLFPHFFLVCVFSPFFTWTAQCDTKTRAFVINFCCSPIFFFLPLLARDPSAAILPPCCTTQLKHPFPLFAFVRFLFFFCTPLFFFSFPLSGPFFFHDHSRL